MTSPLHQEDDKDADPMESNAVRWLAALLVFFAFCAVLQKLGIPMNWPFN